MTKQVCFSGAGKGRLVFGQNRHLFSYESIQFLEEEKWSIAINIPLKGEERFDLFYREILTGKYRAKGRFLGPIFSGSELTKEEKRGAKLLKRFLRKYAIFLKFAQNPGEWKCQGGESSGSCEKDSKAMNWKKSGEKLSVFFELPREKAVIFEFFSPNGDGYYSRATFDPNASSKDTSLKSKDFKLDLFITSCESAAQRS